MKAYKKLIKSFIDQGYQPAFFTKTFPRHKALLLRHDIDFDVEYACALSRTEDELNVKSSYFFLLRSQSYNLLEPANVSYVKSIKARGHQVSLHFDPRIYEDTEKGLEEEINLFEQLFETKVHVISIHRPGQAFLNGDVPIKNLLHTYQPPFFKAIHYCADSQGRFRYGHPLDSPAFKNKESMQLLIHPLWWVSTGENAVEKLEAFLADHISRYQKHMADNCKPYREALKR